MIGFRLFIENTVDQLWDALEQKGLRRRVTGNDLLILADAMEGSWRSICRNC